MEVSFKVKPVIRYMVTRDTSDPERGAGSHEVIGVFEHEQMADEVMKCMLEVHLALVANCAKSKKDS